MSDIRDDHPSREILAAFAEGRSTGTDLARLEEHISGCHVCASTIGNLDSDQGLARRVGAAVAETAPSHPENISLSFLEPSPRPDALGRIGHYDVMEVLGRGGFGIVLKAFDDSLQRVVALKVMAPELAITSPARQRFLREARAAAAVRHENVIQIYSVSEQPLPYLVMEFIPGETLQQRLDRTGPLVATDAASIGFQIASGLAAAHALGLIHRDIKPSNIMLDNSLAQRVKLTDFGLARAVDDASLTQSGVVAGTPLYMSPEQARGEDLDVRSDLFSLGSVMYVTLSGRPPFRAAGTVAVLKRVCEDTPRPIEQIIADAPRWLCQIISRLHSKRPEDRFQSAREVAALLEPSAVERVRTQREPTATQSRATASRLRYRIGLAGGLAIAAAGIAVQMGLTEKQPQTQVASASSPAKPSTRVAAAVPTAKPADTQKRGPAGATASGAHPDGLALSFDGVSSYVHVESLSRNDDGPATIEAWLKPVYQAAAQVVILNSGSSTFQITKLGQGLFPIAKYTLLPSLDESPAYFSGEWIHVASVIDSEEVRTYINGQVRLKLPQQKQQIHERYPYEGLWLAASPPRVSTDQMSYHYRGLMDEVRISNVARYRENFTPATRFSPDAETLALYHCDDGSGARLQDDSGRKHDGKVVAVQWVDAQHSKMTSLLPPNGSVFRNVDVGGPATWQVIDGHTHGKTADTVTSKMRIGHFLPPRLRVDCEALVTGNSGIDIDLFVGRDMVKSYHVEWEGKATGSIAEQGNWRWMHQHQCDKSTEGVWTRVEVDVQKTTLTAFVNGDLIATIPIPEHTRIDLQLEMDGQHGPSHIDVRKLEFRRSN